MDHSEFERITKVYFQWCRRNGITPSQPSRGNSSIETHESKNYAVLRNVNGVMAVWKVTPTRLVRLYRWPKEIK